MNNYKKKGNTVLKLSSRIASFILYMFLIVIMVIGFIAVFIGIAFVQEKIFLKGPYITYMTKSPYSHLVFLILILVSGIIFAKFNKMDQKYSLLNKINRYITIAIIPLLYIVLTSVIVVTDDGIYDYSFYNLKGTKYSFSDVDYVNTGFVDRGRNKGEFFYNVELKSGKKLKLAYPSLTQPGPRYDYDTWQEYVDIDKYIMELGAKKDSSEKGSKYVDMDKKYTDKLLSVIRNKN